MSYKIAYASTDGIQIDRSFGGAEKFTIVEVTEGRYHIIETRTVDTSKVPETEEGCAGACGNAGGCGQGKGASLKVDMIADCRCIICLKVGFHIQKQLERLAIVTFDVDCTVEEALDKIIAYYERVDGHKTVRR